MGPHADNVARETKRKVGYAEDCERRRCEAAPQAGSEEKEGDLMLFTEWTREYAGGLMVGFAVGIIFCLLATVGIDNSPFWLFLVAFLISTFGYYLVQSGQRRRKAAQSRTG